MLNKEPNANPNKNYLILQTAITDSMNTHLTKKVIKFNRKKHKRDPWMTYGILNSVNRKNLLYKKLRKSIGILFFLIPKSKSLMPIKIR